jgi:hypothetical protein
MSQIIIDKTQLIRIAKNVLGVFEDKKIKTLDELRANFGLNVPFSDDEIFRIYTGRFRLPRFLQGVSDKSVNMDYIKNSYGTVFYAIADPENKKSSFILFSVADVFGYGIIDSLRDGRTISGNSYPSANFEFIRKEFERLADERFYIQKQ